MIWNNGRHCAECDCYFIFPYVHTHTQAILNAMMEESEKLRKEQEKILVNVFVSVPLFSKHQCPEFFFGRLPSITLVLHT